jgi:4-amino-4-deoxy-L-arabinose transferase-like glycosyltransferase
LTSVKQWYFCPKFSTSQVNEAQPLMMTSRKFLLTAILAAALLLRLSYGLAQDPFRPYLHGEGDSWWYLAYGYGLATGVDLGLIPLPGLPGTGLPAAAVPNTGWIALPGNDGLMQPVALAGMPTAPLYLLFIGALRTVFPPTTAILIIRVLQALMGTATCYFACKLAEAATGDTRAGLLAGAVVAISPVFVIESAQILTETTYVFFAAAGLWCYIRLTGTMLSSNIPETVTARGLNLWLLDKKSPLKGLRKLARGFSAFSAPGFSAAERRLRRSAYGGLKPAKLPPRLTSADTTTNSIRYHEYRTSLFSDGFTLVLTGVLLGLATLTRAVLLLFPLGLAIHLLMVYGWRRGLRAAALLLAAYGLVVSTWTVYNKVKWNQWVIGAQGMSAFLFIGATQWNGPQAVDRALAQTAGGHLPGDSAAQQQLYQQAAAESISKDPVGWITRRVTELAKAYAQPHGTTFFPGASLRDMAADWLRNDRTLGGLLALTRADAFWPKLAVYLFHYIGLAFGLVGLWLTRRRWRVTLALAGFILYTSLLHLVLDAIPRYIFPTEVFWWVFAAGALVSLWDWLARRVARRPAPAQRSPAQP